jgi:uncharacterized protein YjlB
MPLKDQIKNFTRKLVENKPGAVALADMVHRGKVATVLFDNDGIVPNHPRWPLIIHRRSVRFRGGFDPATIIDTLFASNGWGRSWRDTIYNFVHYHSQTHEVLGVARGDAVAEFGGIKGKRLKVGAGDIVVLRASPDQGEPELSSRGRLPAIGHCTDTRDLREAMKRIAKVKRPPRDPVHGKQAGIALLWR